MDVASNTVLAEHAYTPGDEYHVVRFTLEDNCEDVVVRSYVPESETDENEGEPVSVYGYTLTSDGYVCNDAKWEMLMIAMFLIAAVLGIRLWLSRNTIYVLVLTLLSGLASLPYVGNNLLYGHDLYFHMARIFSLAKAMNAGDLPQRLLEKTGGASIIPTMYPELVLYGAGFMVASGATVFLAYKATCIAITTLTAWLAYISARLVVSERTALLFAVIYVLLPFRLNELFIRASVGEAFAMAFIPVAAAGMWLVMCGEAKGHSRKGFLCLVLGYTGLISSHIIGSVITAAFCALFVVVVLLRDPLRFVKEAKRLLHLAGAAAVTLMLNLWFILPFATYFGWDFFIKQENGNQIQNLTATIWSLFKLESYVESDLVTMKRANSLTLGPAALICFLLIAGMILLDARNRRCSVSKDSDLDGTGISGWLSDGENHVVSIVGPLALIGLYMCTDLFPWDWLSEHSALFDATLAKIQFAWRILTVAAPLVCVLMVIVIRALHRSRQKFAHVFICTILFMCLWTGWQTCSDYLQMDDSYGKYDNQLVINRDYVLASADNEIYTAWLTSGSGPEIQVAGEDAGLTSSESDAAQAGAKIVDYHAYGTDYVFSFENTTGEDITVTVPVFWYGLHTAYLDMDAAEAENAVGSGDASVSAEEEEGNVILSSSMNDALQFTDIVIPGDVTSGTVSLIYEELQSWRYAEWISLGTAIVLVLYIAAVAMMRRIKPSKAPASDQ